MLFVRLFYGGLRLNTRCDLPSRSSRADTDSCNFEDTERCNFAAVKVRPVPLMGERSATGTKTAGTLLPNPREQPRHEYNGERHRQSDRRERGRASILLARMSGRHNRVTILSEMDGI